MVTMRTDIPDYVHNGISCDECGVCPIAGVRYKSTTTYDYDLCQDCKCLNHDNEQQQNTTTREQFVAFERPVSRADASKVGPTKVNRIYAGSAQDAEQQLLREGKNAHVAFFRFYGKTPTQTECRKVVEFINRYTFLTTINVCLFCLQNAERAFAAIATGLATNEHVKHLSLRLMPLWNQDTFFDTSSVQNLIETNTVLESLHIGHAFLRDDFYYYTSNNNNNNNGSYYESEDKFAFDIFESLQKNRTLKTFRLETISSLSATTLESACRAAVRNPMLIRVFAKFQNDNNNNDNNKLLLLSMLTSFNRYQWMKRWTDISAKPKDRLKIMEEIIFCTSSSNNNNMTVNTSALFHLFRSFPEALTYTTTTTTTAPAAAVVPSTTTTTPMME